LLLVSGADGAARVAAALRDKGWAASRLTVLERLGGPAERRHDGTATDWAGRPHDPLAVVAVRLAPDPGTTPRALVPGLPDEAYDSDGVLTKREVRAVTLASLVPLPGQLLWDVGAGSGSVAIEWLRADPTARAIAIEPRADRGRYITTNAAALGVPELRLIAAPAPAALADLPAPDAVFIGGGLTSAGTVDACLAALRPGGRLVANAVTIETEAALAGWHRELGGTLTRIAVSRAAPVGSYTAFRPALPVTQWAYSQGAS
jgi:precorrin-6Y C5,15-methyltransferase (decarboxylating)